MVRRVRRVLLLALPAILLTLPLAGCAQRRQARELKDRREKEKDMEAQIAPHRQPLAVNESVVYEFEADGLWHPAPIAIYSGQRIKIIPAGTSAALGKGVIEFRIERRRQNVTDRSEFVVTQPGRLSFRLDPKKAPGFIGKVQASVTRLE
jgi:hypothetical protein